MSRREFMSSEKIITTSAFVIVLGRRTVVRRRVQKVLADREQFSPPDLGQVALGIAEWALIIVGPRLGKLALLRPGTFNASGPELLQLFPSSKCM